MRSSSIILLFLFTSLIGMAQSSQDLNFVTDLVSTKKAKKAIQKSPKVISDKNAIDQTTNIVFHVYKNYVSSQDGNYCNFMPSCSRYCAQSIQKHGVFKGGVMSFDRLARCHGLSPHKYQKNLKYRKLVDEVK